MADSTLLIARQVELDRLDFLVDQARRGQGQLCLIAGEAGAGKSALVSEFSRQAQERLADLVVAIGICDAQTGIGDPYLPFREALNLLVGNVDARLSQGAITAENAVRLKQLFSMSGEALVELGPDLVDLFVPGAGLLMGAGKYLLKRAGWVDKLKGRLERKASQDVPIDTSNLKQENIFEQYTNVLRSLAAQRPLVLILDDLQWADDASLALLFHLGRRLEGSRILVIGTYRPDEVSLARAAAPHPLEKILAEFKRYFGDILIDLNQAVKERGREFVDRYLDSEPNRLGDAFRQALAAHTRGHPLFTIELLRNLQESRMLAIDAQGYWVEMPGLEWNRLPARVEGVIEARVQRLPAALRDCLSTASVEGEYFTAEATAKILSIEARDLVRELSGALQREYQLVESQGVQRFGQQRLSRYRFNHNLVQAYLYQRLDPVERSYLHEDTGLVLEALYDGQADRFAVQLAQHFELAGLADKAGYYLERAGEQAAAGYANEAAADYFSRALQLLPPDNQEARFRLLLAREKVYALLGRREQQQADLEALAGIPLVRSDPQKQAAVALRRGWWALYTGHYAAAIAAAQEAAAPPGASGNGSTPQASLLAEASLLQGQALIQQGELAAAHRQIEDSLRLSRQDQNRFGEARSLERLGTIFWSQGDLTAARLHLEQALPITRELGDRQREASVLTNLGVIDKELGDYTAAAPVHLQALAIGREIGDRQVEGLALVNLGEVYLQSGDYDLSLDYSHRAYELAGVTGDRRGQGIVLINLGEVYFALGDDVNARSCAGQALAIFSEIGYRMGESIILGNLAQYACRTGDLATARAHGLRALEVARAIDDRIGQGTIFNILGEIELKSGGPDQAVEFFRQALETNTSLGLGDGTAEAKAGLAAAHTAGTGLAAERQAQVRGYMDDVLAYIREKLAASAEAGPLPAMTVLRCLKALQALQDPEAESLSAAVRERLHRQAQRIQDPELRRAFLEQVPAHRELLALPTHSFLAPLND